jgi:DNA-binding response OmpR family regulator
MPEKLKILIVDDNPMVLNTLYRGLSIQNHDCVTANNGNEALEALKTERFDIMATDVVMPDIDGFQLTRMAKSLYPEMHVIILTGYASDESREKAIEVDASDFIKKPFTVNDLITRIENVIRTRP